VRVLTALRKLGLRTAVVSDCWYELPELLPTLPAYRLLDAHIYSVRVGRCKPDPAMYLTACAELGVAPNECLYVGDGGSRELTGAVAAGLTAVRLNAPDLGEHLSFEPDVEFDGPSVTSLNEIVDLFDTPRLDRQPALI
jgi:putative hydrolase of the HAD superfamily